MRLSPLQRKEIADKFLAWLKEKNITTCDKSYTVIEQCSNDLNEQIFELWRGYELLRTMGRIELNCPNGKKGFHVIDYTPLSVYQLKSDEFKKKIQKEMLVKILTNLKKQFKNIWDESLAEVK